jgi:hypothetical protein
VAADHQRLDSRVAEARARQTEIGQQVEEAFDGRFQNAAGDADDQPVNRPEAADEEQRARRNAADRERDGHDRAEEQQDAHGDPQETEWLVGRRVGPVEEALEQRRQAQARKARTAGERHQATPIDFRHRPS